MCDQDGVGVDTTAAERSGGEVLALAERYASISSSFQTETSLMSEGSCNEMVVALGILDYAANVVGQLIQLQAHTGALGDSAQAGAAAARQADNLIGTGLGSIYAV